MVLPHKKIRRSCKKCPLPEGHKHNGDSHRFHGVGSFCRTHHNTRNTVVYNTCFKRSGAHGSSGTRSEKEYRKKYGRRRR